MMDEAGWNIQVWYGEPITASLFEFMRLKGLLLTDAKIRSMMMIPSQYLKEATDASTP